MNNLTSSLHDEKTFYKAFLRDLEQCQKEVIIESPFITSERMKTLWSILRRLYVKGVKIFIVTRDPKEHIDSYDDQSESAIEALEDMGIQVLLCTGNHHRKLAIIDRTILWEGSLNILSQIHSREIMRRLEGGGFAVDMFNFLNFGRYI
ncbi:MAG: phospholipase D-like domain-containing protein [Candidatus Shapirobacteria bacterium]|nr:phospholipase D-like domain-containing protein [Candidatus Shapirobacteria bacterium]